jgi:hypothetical protein
MHRTRGAIPGTLVLTLILSINPGGPSPAQGSEPAKPSAEVTQSPRGGSLAKTARHQFEVFFYKTGLRVFPRDASGKPVAASSLTGSATFNVPGASNPSVYPLRGAGNDSIDLALDLGRIPASGASVAFKIDGLADPAEPTATFSVPFALTANATAGAGSVASAPGNTPRAVPATLAITRATSADQPAINAQRACKISGESLGSMGTPIKVTRGDRTIFLCCQSCVRRVQANPDQYLR